MLHAEVNKLLVKRISCIRVRAEQGLVNTFRRNKFKCSDCHQNLEKDLCTVWDHNIEQIEDDDDLLCVNHFPQIIQRRCHQDLANTADAKKSCRALTCCLFCLLECG